MNGRFLAFFFCVFFFRDVQNKVLLNSNTRRFNPCCKIREEEEEEEEVYLNLKKKPIVSRLKVLRTSFTFGTASALTRP
jgi:hypothetical protein